MPTKMAIKPTTIRSLTLSASTLNIATLCPQRRVNSDRSTRFRKSGLLLIEAQPAPLTNVSDRNRSGFQPNARAPSHGGNDSPWCDSFSRRPASLVLRRSGGTIELGEARYQIPPVRIGEGAVAGRYSAEVR